MRILSVEMKNFKTVRQSQRLKLSNRGLVCIVGSNGAGKTTIEDALVWALSGKTLSGLKGNDVVNEDIGRNCHVRLRFQDAHDHVWRVDRYRKHKRYRNRLFLWQRVGPGRWVDKSRHVMEETEAEIRKHTRLDFTSFVVSTVVGQGVLAPFSAMSAPEQSKVIDTITGNDVVQVALSTLRERKSTVKAHLDELLHDVESLTTRCEDAKGYVRKAKAGAVEERKRKKERLQICSKSITKARRTLKEAIEAEKAAKERDDRVKALQSRLDAVKKRFELADGQKTTYLVEERELRKQMDRYNAVLKKGAKGVGYCEHCGGQIDNGVVKGLCNNVEALYDIAHQAYTKSADEVKGLRDLWEKLAKEIRAQEPVKDSSWSVAHARDYLREAKEALQVVKKEKPTWREAWLNAKKRMAKLETQLAQSKKKAASAKRQLAYVLHAEREYSHDIPLDIQDASLPFLNKKAARFSKIITDGIIDVEFATEKTNKGGNTKEGICVTTQNARGGSKYIQQSKGERQKIDLVVASSIQALNTEMARAGVNTVFYDEPFDALDAASVERVMQFLQEELKTRESVFVITHNVALQSHFNNVIEVSKPEGGTIFSEV